MKRKNRIRIYTQNDCRVELKQSKKAQYDVHPEGIKSFLNYIHQSNAQAGTYKLKASSLPTLKDVYFSHYKQLVAGGGVVVNNKQEILLIFRRGFWDLPKGKAEKGETIEQTAVREVEEETGLTKVSIIAPIQLLYNGENITYHTYTQKGKQIMKPSHWFIMKASKQTLIPQTEEDIEQAIWVPIKQIATYYSKAYPAIVDVLKAAVVQLNK